MTRKRRRLIGVLAGLGMLGIATALVLTAFSDNLVFFYSPSDLKTKHVAEGRRLRIGGLVENASLKREADGKTFEFSITDGENSVPVTYTGLLPDLFREGQGVVIQGMIGSDGMVRADEVLAKHDERYMPKEVVDALKKSGHWQEGEGTVAR
ncbi:MAG TPA: cytochrome c maturation protein CcmE [Stellaceae bacterium]|jgi:cytochrome c-type biogenesis protein CcmE|nr:cytochrome c maturation protein CcmE [Stellaceae bacterium]